MFTFRIVLPYLIKHVNIHLLKGMSTAELINLVMNFVINPCIIILHTIIEKCLIHVFLLEPVDHLKKEAF